MRRRACMGGIGGVPAEDNDGGGAARRAFIPRIPYAGVGPSPSPPPRPASRQGPDVLRGGAGEGIHVPSVLKIGL